MRRTALPRWQRAAGASRLTFLGHRRSLSYNNSFLEVAEEVQEAIESQKPIVALETTIYTHGS